LKVKANAKINLGLKVVGRRTDGFHDIHSVFQEVSLGDEVELERLHQGKIDVVCPSSVIPDGRNNLAYKAADALREAAARTDLGAKITIHKQIPVGGGLGGGSADAAQVLVALNVMWELEFSTQRLMDIGSSVGSDVPFLVQGGTAAVSGRGEVLQGIDLSGDLWFVLVSPGFSVSTPWAFGKLNIELTSEGPYIRFLNSVRASGEVDLLDLISRVENDFLPLVSARYPSIQRILSVFRDAGALGTSMSGTGATLYGGFALHDDAQKAIACLQRQGYQTFLCKPVRRPSTESVR
jgi:4-diphosphocytidyl-2-C-methyl-D-erythritol kinase